MSAFNAVFPTIGGIGHATSLWLLKKLLTVRRDDPAPEPWYNYPMWWFIVGLFGLSELCVDVGGRDINGSSLYQIASLATGLAYSFFALKETLMRKDLVAYALIITGALLALWVVDLVEVSVLVFVIYVFLIGFALFFLYLGIWHYRKKLGTSSMGDPQNKRIRKTMPILYSAITAVIQALIYVPAILFVAAYDHVGFVIFVFVVAFLAATGAELYWMTKALMDFDYIYILAMFHVTLRILDFIITGLFGGFSGKSVLLYVALPLCGIMFELIGAYVLSLRENYTHYSVLGMDDPEGGAVNPNFAAPPAAARTTSRYVSDSGSTDDAGDLRPTTLPDSDVYSDEAGFEADAPGRSSGSDLDDGPATVPVNRA
ncbi:uncharacterized protein AMSG_03256 [Thecamonas trahens ATCC 50062]|uniref:Uncharacterized protein n=1 Tax=Thecamonas trahens ATCC 50062 TaxID=461836 RepID=A0A0L0D3L9_THETB|nr:hypothetical protein AMSG_03256 [Thecamonas trahens ATCC 50062]KNC46825.1 hypothetical protein AMSG_03256 [Thecamonas trahens ATCC 50062]|eukprot:XP_013760100.1 hypothetical protein AMSG_03256 [Thecamonas trahens ATCC 50062]